ncbi:ionotropic receptor 40a [Photinus pyralis]|nr:ionotropic receptor 40a [Photinus pyralis]
MNEFMKIIVITNPRPGTYRLYYNQALSYKRHHLEMVNWWNSVDGLFRRPTLPSPGSIFNNFNGKVFKIPVIHKPPWHFVRYVNDCIEVLGGRDDKLLTLLSQSLNFRFEYFDPPDRNQGSSVLENGSFEGVLGLIGKRKADFFIGDVTLTLERLSVVEFSFLTLADSVAFVTHAPSRLNEALALVRPFHWQVWPAVVATLIISGPILYVLIALPNRWQPRRQIPSRCKLFFECCWFTTTLFFKQTGREPSSSNKCRFFIIILSLSATYIISDMYSANLTSLLAKPGREKSINNLIELEEAMINRKFKLYVERLSSSYSLLENGTGIYGRLWNMMTHNQHLHVIDSVEEGVKLVRRSIDIAIIAGRETLYFDIQRFGAKNFHLSEKLNTAYSAIAFQIGCPYIENFNKILMAIFEAGILTKMTDSEYENLGKRQKTEIKISGVESEAQKQQENENDLLDEKDEELQPINIKMLQGAFYLLFLGCGFSACVLGLEILFERQQYKVRRALRVGRKKHIRFKRRCRYYCRKLRKLIRAWFRQMLHDAFVDTLEYTE